MLRHEPYGALVSGGSRGLDDPEHIVRCAGRWLRPGASLVLEHGADQREALLETARETRSYDDVVDLDDLSGRPRVLVARSRP